jgi:YafQ family addiction module toxin component
MRKSEISSLLKKKLKKILKKDKNLYEQILKKIYEIIKSDEDIEHYKNLKHNLKDSKRVHIGSFVLVFKYDKEKDIVYFDDFDHHDNIYKS